jgi:hypothetical protein
LQASVVLAVDRSSSEVRLEIAVEIDQTVAGTVETAVR